MAGDDRVQPRFRILVVAGRLDDLLVELVHSETHDREQQILLALDVVVEPGLGQSTAAAMSLIEVAWYPLR